MTPKEIFQHALFLNAHAGGQLPINRFFCSAQRAMDAWKAQVDKMLPPSCEEMLDKAREQRTHLALVEDDPECQHGEVNYCPDCAELAG